MEGFFVIIVIVLVFVIYAIRTDSHQKSIENKVKSFGGTLIGYERRSVFSGIGPFHIVGEGRMVYRIEYELGGEKKEGWVRFGGIMGPDWRF